MSSKNNNEEIDCWELWEWDLDNPPFWGELTMHREKYRSVFIGREELIERAYRQLIRQVKSHDNGVTLVCGPPGVGKSTFVEFLLHEKFKLGRGKRISLIGLSDHPLRSNTELKPYQLLDIVSQIESFINLMLSGNHPSESETKIQKKFSEYLRNTKNTDYDEFDLIDELISAEIIPKCKFLHDQTNIGKIDQHYMAIDDVDYLSTESQMLLLSILCKIADVTSNPTLLYSARPVAAGVAKQSVASRINHRVTEPIRIPSINSNSMIQARITNSGKNKDAINPFIDDKVQSLFENICNGNLRVAISLVKACINQAHLYINKDNLYFTKEDVLSILFGPKVVSKEDLLIDHDLRYSRSIINVFSNFSLDEVVPLIYVTLLTTDRLKNPRLNSEFEEMFNRICLEINPAGVGQRTVKRNTIVQYLTYCHRTHLITRKAFGSFDKYITKRKELKDEGSLEETIFDLTKKGQETLLLSRDPFYQSISGFHYLRTELRKNINAMKFTLLQQDGTYVVEEIR